MAIANRSMLADILSAELKLPKAIQAFLQHTALHRPKRVGLYIHDGLATILSGYLTICIDRSVFPLPPSLELRYLSFLPILLLFRLGMHCLFGVYRISARHIGLPDVVRIASATAASSLLLAVYLFGTRHSSAVSSTVLIGWYVHLSLIASVRVGYRLLMQYRSAHGRDGKTTAAQRMLIIGAGVRGASLVREMRVRAGSSMHVVGFVDDDPAKLNLLIDGVPVLGPIANLPLFVRSKNVNMVAIAIGGLDGKLLRQTLQLCEGLGVRFQVAPDMDVLKGNRRLQTLRNVSLEDLLQRESKSADMAEIGSYLSGERVLITGAGGSIGSELVRQIAAANPEQILLLGHGENSLFEIQQELLRNGGLAPVCLVADIRDYSRLLRMFVRLRPTIVFHAAAHKHVGLMQSNPEEAVTNNVLGTRNLARIASKTGVKRFVMISTDKAVNPTSIMGMTKRIAERVIQAESRRSTTEFACVRFGNVLGSRGSVVPLMRKQIENGFPVTITHPDVTRYFMTIPEAAQLVIQAGAMGGKGTVYLLEMGEPVRIMDLAMDLIRLSGLAPYKDVPIEITGLRPGEKLYEELLTAEEGAQVTQFERVYAAPPARFSIESLDFHVDALIASAQAGDVDDVLSRIQNIDRVCLLEPALEHDAAISVPAGRMVQSDNTGNSRLKQAA